MVEGYEADLGWDLECLDGCIGLGFRDPETPLDDGSLAGRRGAADRQSRGGFAGGSVGDDDENINDGRIVLGGFGCGCG